MSDELTTRPNAAKQAIHLTEKLLRRAADIDPAAWRSPMRGRMQPRRSRSYAQAVAELKNGASAP